MTKSYQSVKQRSSRNQLLTSQSSQNKSRNFKSRASSHPSLSSNTKAFSTNDGGEEDAVEVEAPTSPADEAAATKDNGPASRIRTSKAALTLLCSFAQQPSPLEEEQSSYKEPLRNAEDDLHRHFWVPDGRAPAGEMHAGGLPLSGGQGWPDAKS